MSRWIEHDRDNRIIETIADTEECKYLMNEVCTNPKSDQCCDFPHHEYCEFCCPHFTKEDGVIKE